ncbi:hypothetical protein L0Z11_11245 [Burkholderia multivorans]|uniref:hypothetical protein n=1 Tax=Burkholderia multivorans TaxID=87883 RepID=UPI002018C61D|nr:hypothetical protein [Burkholderia multivorans]UQN68260.1 hypothetical protein L0Z45_11265 [Burkholderia multivorans]UQN73989.1 hypothetical protein L0Z11_11245 [Burkholderia multivorans]
MMKRLLAGSAALLASTAAVCATMIPSSMINWISVPSWPSVSAGTIFAGPAATAGVPTFRALVATDLPVVPVAKGGTNATAAGGAALDNITAFSGTGFLKRTGAGAYAFVADPLPLANGGTGATTATGARTALGAAASGANTDITSLSAPALGAATATTATAGDNTTKVATTAYVQTAVTGGSNAASFTTINASGLISPSTTAGIKATTTNDDVQAGSVGEYVCAQVTNGGNPSGCVTNGNTAVTISTTNTPVNITSLPLQAGDWEVSGYAVVGCTVACSGVFGTISTTSATFPSPVQTYAGLTTNSALITGMNMPLAPVRIKLSAPATVYLVAQAVFSSGSGVAHGIIRARRPR